jgi:Fibronectin type III domain
MATGLALAALAIGAVGASAAAPTILSTSVSEVTASSATLEASINPNGKKTAYHFEYGPAECGPNPCTSVPVPEGEIPTGSSPVTKKVTVTGLSAGSTYHFRVLARNGITVADKAESPDRVFATRSVSLAGLPDGRAYEQASPVDKDGGDAIGTVPQLKASPEGNAITFSSTVGAPGGVGAQEIPLYLASRSAGGWSTQGLLPPASAGQRARVLGWLPGFFGVFSSAIKLGNPEIGALLVSGSGSLLEELTPYVPDASYTFLGSAGEGAEVVFESRAPLGSPAGIEGASNVYAWDRESGEVSLVSVDNEEQSLPKGAFGGSYDWAFGMTPTALGQGGAARNYYSQDQHVVGADGSVFFTEAGSGQLYVRLNPTQPQSELDGEGKCEEPQKACTIQVSASKRTLPDPAGPRPAAFMGAAADGSAAFFTSPEKLTDDANTGPSQPEPKIGRAGLDGTTDLLPDWLANHRAVGLAVDSEYIYWADPVDGAIGRAELNGENANDEFIKPGTTTVEEEIENPPGSEHFETITKHPPSTPRYVAVDAGHVYWSNTADGKELHGTIGRATINPVTKEAEDIRPECITNASNPQGIAVNIEHIYWANSGSQSHRSIGRAEIGCGGAVQKFQPTGESFAPQGVALSATHIYWTAVADSGDSYLQRAPLGGTTENPDIHFINKSQPRGIAVAGENVYWAAQGEKAIGHATWPDANAKPTTVNEEFIELEGAPSGVGVDSGHIYWSTDGETLPSPGNDLYRFEPDGQGGGSLTDLAPDPTDENGAEVQGVVGVSGDGSRVYFTANADLDGAGPAQVGNCRGPLSRAQGQCSLYLWHEGTTSFVARLNANGSTQESDAANWAPTTTGIFPGSDPQKTAFLSAPGGETLLFRSQEQLTAYDNEGVSELYRYREGEPILCLSCNPSGEAPKGGVILGSLKPSALRSVEPAILASRNLSADGERAFFETSEALVSTDTNGQGGCLGVGAGLQRFPTCQDVYEWEAPGSGSCEESSPPYSPLNGGCLYLLSTGKDDYPSFFADASTNGNDVFLFTRQGLVGQDKDELLDVYDARVGGGLAAQNPVPVLPCESSEACHGPIPPPPAEAQPTSQAFVGPGNATPKHTHHKKPRKHKKHKLKKKQKHHKQRRANFERGVGR